MGIPQALENTIGTFADEGLRTIAVAYRDCDTAPDMEDGDAVEQNLTLIALLGLEDPVRPEVRAPVAETHKHTDACLSRCCVPAGSDHSAVQATQMLLARRRRHAAQHNKAEGACGGVHVRRK